MGAHVDMCGREIVVGDLVAYAVQQNQSAVMRIGAVLRLESEERAYNANTLRVVTDYSSKLITVNGCEHKGIVLTREQVPADTLVALERRFEEKAKSDGIPLPSQLGRSCGWSR